MSKASSMGKTAVGGAGWRFAERICAQLVTFVVSTVLARILSPDEYGQIAIVTAFITIANVFVSDGFSAALIQKKEVDSLDYSSVLIGGFGVSIVIYAILFAISPLVASFYNAPILSPVLRVLALRVPLASINSVESAYLSRNMQFRKFFLATIVGTLISGVVGIVMAYRGFGIWALVAQNLTNYTIDILILAIVIRKFPPLKMSFERLKSLFSFGGKILATNLIFQFISQLRTMIIGKKYSTSELSFYTKGQYFPNLIGQNISVPVASVLFPMISKMQGDIQAVKAFVRKSVHFITFVVTPLLLGLAAVSKPLVTVLLTEKWLPCVPFIWYGAIYHSFVVIHSTNLEAVKGIGAGNQVLKYGNIKRAVSIATLLATFWISPEAIAIGLIASALIATCINAYQNKKLFGYTYREQFLDIIPNMLLGWIMCGSVYAIGELLPTTPFVTLVIQILAGVVIYVLLALITRNKSFFAAIKVLKKKTSKA